jgi:DNA-binding NtrC family response regulator
MDGIDNKYAKKVLIVDDEPHILRVLKLKLENAGYEVLTAVNGIDGLEQFVKKKPTVVITDINMPYVDGRELYKMMEAHKRKDPYFVIVMTSLVDGAIHRWAKEISNIHFVEKPFSPSNILNLINEYFSKLHETKSTL